MTAAPIDPQVKPRYSWAEIWTAVLTRPSVNTFQEILRDPAMSRPRAYLWMMVTWFITIVFMMVVAPTDPEAIRAQLPPDMDISTGALQNAMFVSSLCALPLALIFAMGIFRVMVWFVQMIARVVGAESKNDSGTHLTYTFAAIQAPLNIISLLFLVLPASPILLIISLLATVYQFALMTLAVRTVYNLSWGRAMIPIVALASILVLVIGLFLR